MGQQQFKQPVRRHGKQGGPDDDDETSDVERRLAAASAAYTIGKAGRQAGLDRINGALDDQRKTRS